MPSSLSRNFILFLLVITILPFTATAQTENATDTGDVTNTEVVDTTTEERVDVANRGFLRDGIFGCSAGAYAMPVGTLQAIGGVYVPVNDAAVTQNTGYLVYKECVLDGVVVRMREAASGAFIDSSLTWANKGRNGGPQFVTDPEAAKLERSDAAWVEFLKNYNIQNVCSPFRTKVRSALATQYINARSSSNSYSCTLTISDDQYSQLLSGGIGDSWGGFFELAMKPYSNTPFFAYQQAQSAAERRASREVNDFWEQVILAGGFYPAEQIVKNPTDTGEDRVTRTLLTPGSVIAQNISQIVGSGFRQLESANEIDQIVNSLLSGITNQILTNVRGLTGLSESQLGKPPYLDQLSAEASAGVRTAATNTALSVLNSSLATEKAYNTSKNGTKDALEQAVAKLKAAENRCWEIMIPAVQKYAQDAACTGTSVNATLGLTQTSVSCGPVAQLNISTSTEMITGGTLALTLATSTITSGSIYNLPVSPSSVITQGSAQLTVNQTQEYASSTSLGLSFDPVAAPSAGATVSIPIQALVPFSGGTLSFSLVSGKKLPIGEVRFALLSNNPITQAAVSLTVGVAQQFSDAVIETRVQPALDAINTDINASNDGLVQLASIVNDVQNTASLTAQRIALERLDTLVAQGLLHGPYDVKSAEQQKEATQASMDTLVEDTVNDWGSGSGWCNAENENVVRMWYERWKVN